MSIAGAGIIGLSCAWELVRRGVSVSIWDIQPPHLSASDVAAGMLGPAFEAAHSNAPDDFLELCLESKSIWTDFASSIQDNAHNPVDYHEGYTLAVACNAQQAEDLDSLETRLRDKGIACERGLSPELRSQNQLSGAVLEGLKLPTDGWVNPRLVFRQLTKALALKGVQVVRGIDTEFGNEPVDIEVCAGWRVPQEQSCLAALPSMVEAWRKELQVHTVRGCMLNYSPQSLKTKQVVRCGDEYVVPRAGDECTYLGATVGDVEGAESFLEARARGFLDLRDGVRPVGGRTGFRPRFADGLPRIGPLSDRVFVAMGHYRNGILLAPITAKLIADMILGAPLPEYAARFTP
ncbi:MAG: FAD-dependent oxidoreductase [Pseudomonadota bacterium]